MHNLSIQIIYITFESTNDNWSTSKLQIVDKSVFENCTAMHMDLSHYTTYEHEHSMGIAIFVTVSWIIFF